MGMFDSFIWQDEEYQVKCFYDNGIGGYLREFRPGDEVPRISEEYEYPPDFIVIDADIHCRSGERIAAIHVIRDGRYVKTLIGPDFSSVPQASIASAEKNRAGIYAIDYYGCPVYNISSLNDAEEYARLYIDTQKAVENISRDFWEHKKRLFHYFQDNEISENSEEYRKCMSELEKESEETGRLIEEARRPLREKFYRNK